MHLLPDGLGRLRGQRVGDGLCRQGRGGEGGVGVGGRRGVAGSVEVSTGVGAGGIRGCGGSDESHWQERLTSAGEMLAVAADTQKDTQCLRQAARRGRWTQDKVRKRCLERELTAGRGGRQVAVTLIERDAAVARCERRAGAAWRAMMAVEGLELAHVGQWYGEGLRRAGCRRPRPRR